MTTLADHIEDFLADMGRRRNWRARTLHAYRHDLIVAARHLPMPLAAITTAHLDTVLHDDRRAISTRHRRAAALTQFFQWAMRHGLCASSPITAYSLPQQDRRLPRPIRSQQERKALDAAIAAAPQPYRLIFMILRETGMRANEVLQLNMADVLLDAGREGLRIRDPKNRVERIQVLGPQATPKSVRGLRAWLRALGPRAPHEPLFRSNRGTRVTYAALYYQWAHVCTRAKLVDDHGEPRYTLHQLRHTRGTELIEAGQRLEIVQRVLGHHDPRSTQRYADVHEEVVRQALETGQ
jgi:integrase/recombinase XerD